MFYSSPQTFVNAIKDKNVESIFSNLIEDSFLLPWFKSPWIASALWPLFFRFLANLSAPLLVFTKTIIVPSFEFSWFS